MFASHAVRAWNDPPIAGRRLRCLLALGLVLLLAGLSTVHAQSRPPEKRIALVIGNSQYPKAALANPENDARMIASNLRKLGFEVNEQLNLPVLQFRRALREFARRVQQDDAIAVLYYAGHGLQIDGRNYLLPVDINLRDQEEVKDESVDIDELFLSRIDKVGSFPRIVILDACRNNPFASKTRNIRSSGGLAEMGARGTLIAFASAPGAAAEDGPDGGNSVYTKSLADEMMTPGIEVEQMFKNVRVKVLRDTAGRQLPWVNTSLTSDFSFNPAGSQASTQLAVRQGSGAQPQGESAPTRKDPASSAAAPKDIETALAGARREQVPAPAVAPSAPPVSSAPAAALTPEPQRQSQPATPLSPPTQLAIQTPPQSSALPPASTRKFLDRQELQQLLVGKQHALKEPTSNYVMRWDLRSGGRVYYSSQAASSSSASGSGQWELKEDGSLCAKFYTPSFTQPSAALRPDDGCWFFFREGGKLKRVISASPQAPPQFEVVDIQ